MASPARAAARARAAELHYGGLAEPPRSSWTEAHRVAELWLDHVQRERGKRSMRVLRNVVREVVWRGRWLLDDRHAWQIGESVGVSSKWVRECLCGLERDGFGSRLHMVGFKSKHGLTSNVLVFPELVGLLLDLVPWGARERTVAFLQRADVRAQLEVGGAWSRLPVAVTGAEVPAGISGTLVPGTASQREIRNGCSEIDRAASPPTPSGEPDVERSAGGAVAPSPPIALPLIERPPGPREVPASPPAPAPDTDGRPPANEPEPDNGLPPAATQVTGAAGQRREVPATLLPEHLRGPHAVVREVVAELERQGMPRGEAIRRALEYRRTATWRRHREERDETPGRRLRHRGAARELSALRCEAVLAAWKRTAGDGAWMCVLGAIQFKGAVEHDGVIVLHIEATAEAALALAPHRESLEEIASTALDGRPRVRFHVTPVGRKRWGAS